MVSFQQPKQKFRTSFSPPRTSVVPLCSSDLFNLYFLKLVSYLGQDNCCSPILTSGPTVRQWWQQFQIWPAKNDCFLGKGVSLKELHTFRAFESTWQQLRHLPCTLKHSPVNHKLEHTLREPLKYWSAFLAPLPSCNNIFYCLFLLLSKHSQILTNPSNLVANKKCHFQQHWLDLMKLRMRKVDNQ